MRWVRLFVSKNGIENHIVDLLQQNHQEQSKHRALQTLPKNANPWPGTGFQKPDQGDCDPDYQEEPIQGMAGIAEAQGGLGLLEFSRIMAAARNQKTQSIKPGEDQSSGQNRGSLGSRRFEVEPQSA